MKLGRIERALIDFEQVLRIDPDNVNAALTKASCLNLKVIEKDILSLSFICCFLFYVTSQQGDYVRAID